MSTTSKFASSSTGQGLFPGFKHVKEFGPDCDYEDEAEECYVTLDLGSVDQTLVPSSSAYQLIGLDTPSPFLQLSGTIMKGHHQTLIGTELIFKDDTEESDSPSQSNVQYFASTDRRIMFREVELRPKTAESIPVPPPRKKKYTFSLPSTSTKDTSDVPNAEGPSARISQDLEMGEMGEELVEIPPQPDASTSGAKENNHAQPQYVVEIQEDQNMDMDR